MLYSRTKTLYSTLIQISEKGVYYKNDQNYLRFNALKHGQHCFVKKVMGLEIKIDCGRKHVSNASFVIMRSRKMKIKDNTF